MILITGGAHQGKTAYAMEHFGKECVIIDEYHLKVKEQLKEEKDPVREAERLLEEEGSFVIISSEIGCGLVPTDAFLRRYREAVGRVNCILAERAEQVIRVICGIGTRIK